MKHSISNIIDYLEAENIDVSPYDIADTLWLSTIMHKGDNKTEEVVVPSEDEEECDDESEDVKDNEASEEEETLKEETDKNALYEQEGDGNSHSINSNSTPKGEYIRVPTQKHSNDFNQFAKAMKILRQMVLSKTEYEFDEDNTIEYIANTNNWNILLKPKQELKYTLSIVIEISNSMEIWEELSKEFHLALLRFRFFKDIKVYYAQLEDNDFALYRDKKCTLPASIKTLNTVNMHDITMLLTDCISRGWSDKRGYQFLEDITKVSPLVVINMLPQRIWRRTILGKSWKVKYTHKNGFNNNTLVSDLDEEKMNVSSAHIKVPMATFDTVQLRQWSNLAVGKKNNWINGSIFEANIFDIPISESSPTVLQDINPNILVKNFYKSASPMARELAIYFSTVPLSMDIMKIVQKESLPKSNHTHLAEVFLSGLLKKSQYKTKSGAPRYEYVSGIKDILLERLSLHIKICILKNNSSFIADNIGSIIDFQALFENPSLEGGIPLVENDNIFAYHIADLFEEIGGEHSKAAEKLKKDNTEINKKVFLEKYKEQVVDYLSDMYIDDLERYEIVDYNLPSDDDSASISSQSTPTNITLLNIEKIGNRHYKINITFEIEAELDINIFKSDFYGNDEYKIRYTYHEELNEHYNTVHDEYLLNVNSYLEVGFDDNDELIELDIDSIDEVTILKCLSDDRVDKDLDSIRKESYEINKQVLLENYKEQIINRLLKENIKELDSYVIKNTSLSDGNLIKISSEELYSPFDVDILKIEALQLMQYIVNVEFSLYTNLEKYIDKSEFYNNSEYKSNHIPYVHLEEPDNVILEDRHLLKINCDIDVVIDNQDMLSKLSIKTINEVSIVKRIEVESQAIEGTTFTCKNCSKMHSIDCDSIEWEVVDSDERNMGTENHYEAIHEEICDCDNRMSITFHCWEYPVGVINDSDIESIGVKDLSSSCYPDLHINEKVDYDEDIFLEEDKSIDIDYNYISIVIEYAKQFTDKSLSDVLSKETLEKIVYKIHEYNNRRKGYFGKLVDEYLFSIKNNINPDIDIQKSGIKLKTVPLKYNKNNEYIAKERLSFSMINYNDIIYETWETSDFVKKNQQLLLMFYLYQENVDLTDYKFKVVHHLDLLSDISVEDIDQIKEDWQTIANKIKEGKAHLLTEGDTKYLAASAKGANGNARRPQPNSTELAKPRAFSFKVSFLNRIIKNYIDVPEDEISSSGTSFGLSKSALADSEYKPENEMLESIIDGLKSYNWPKQTDALLEFKNLITYPKDFLFVVGRNIYQASCGNSYTAQNFIKSIYQLTEISDLEDKELEIIVAGLFYEVFFDSKNQFRTRFKVNYFEELLKIKATQKYIKSFDFLSSKLNKHKDKLLIDPMSTDNKVIFDFELQNEDSEFIDYSIKSFVIKDNTGLLIKNERLLNRCSSICSNVLSLSDFYKYLGEYFLLQKNEIEILQISELKGKSFSFIPASKMKNEVEWLI